MVAGDRRRRRNTRRRDDSPSRAANSSAGERVGVAAGQFSSSDAMPSRDRARAGASALGPRFGGRLGRLAQRIGGLVAAVVKDDGERLRQHLRIADHAYVEER